MSTNNKFPKGIEIVVLIVIEDKEDKLLLVKSPKWFNKWVMPGGHIEAGEKMINTVKREALEEVGLKVEPITIISFNEVINSKEFFRPGHVIFFAFLCKSENSDDIKLDNEEIIDYVWVTPEEGFKMDLAKPFRETIKKYIEYKRKNK
ncbi:MAG: NUDIX domain-containing protein [Candidatus Parcubacteria bacterium]|nr:NUDIX domain-containing protein [Candidatus Parcubacteria bacterium]